MTADAPSPSKTPGEKADLRDALITLVSTATLALGMAYFAVGLFTVRVERPGACRATFLLFETERLARVHRTEPSAFSISLLSSAGGPRPRAHVPPVRVPCDVPDCYRQIRDERRSCCRGSSLHPFLRRPGLRCFPRGPRPLILWLSQQCRGQVHFPTTHAVVRARHVPTPLRSLLTIFLPMLSGSPALRASPSSTPLPSHTLRFSPPLKQHRRAVAQAYLLNPKNAAKPVIEFYGKARGWSRDSHPALRASFFYRSLFDRALLKEEEPTD